MDDEQAEFSSQLARARGGDPEAVERILLQTEGRLRRYIESRLGVQMRAMMRNSDVLQNAYLEMIDALPGFAGTTQDDFVAWVTRIIEHDIQRQNRWFGAKKRKVPRTSERNALARILLEPPLTPSAELRGLEQSAQVRLAISRLEPDHARIIELAMLDDLPHKEVAARMGRTEGACRMLLLRARAALAIELEKVIKDDG